MAISDLHHKDPFEILDGWLLEAAASEINDPEAAALATVGKDGFPSVRMVLMRGRDDNSVFFYTNYTSRKAAELDATKKAALCLHWKSLRRQIRLVGVVERLPSAASDAYFHSRPYQSRIGAWGSKQSQPLKSRQVLIDAVADFQQRYPENPPRPAHWGGFRLIPHEIECWIDGKDRLHDRFLFERKQFMQGQWQAGRLYP